MSILFINGSPNKDGNTVQLSRDLLGDKDCKQFDLVDYQINAYGQDLPGDRFDEVLSEFKKADVVVIGSPVYWYSLSGQLRTLLDRFYGPVEEGGMSGKDLVFLFQGHAPTQDMLNWGEHTMKGFCRLYGMRYLGMATTAAEARKLGSVL